MPAFGNRLGHKHPHEPCTCHVGSRSTRPHRVLLPPGGVY